MKFWVWGIYNLFDNGLVRHLLAKLQLNDAGRAALIGGAFALCVIVPYLLGSINWALVISRVFYHDDIRNHGSGNAGATNMQRTFGLKAAIPTFLLDGLKGVISIVLACALFGHPESEPYFFYTVTAAYMAAFFTVFGHVFPCFSHFKGGKGFACTSLCILVLNPAVFCILLFVFFPLVIGTRYVSLGSVVTALFYPVFLSSFDTASATPYGINALFAFLIAALITWAHRSNLKRIMNRTERKISFGKKDKSEGPVDKGETPKE